MDETLGKKGCVLCYNFKSGSNPALSHIIATYLNPGVHKGTSEFTAGGNPEMD